MAMLQVKGVSKAFGGLQALRETSFSLEEGDILGIIGPNGAGKTTLFNVITGFLRPEAGTVSFQGIEVVGLKPHEICKLGMVRTFQIVKPFMNLTVMDNVIIGALNRTSQMQAAKSRAEEILEIVGLWELRWRQAHELTLAQRKRLELARALATGPRLLLLDEVMGGLNPSETDELIDLLKRIHSEGISILLIEHVMKGVMTLSKRVLVLNFGEMIAEGTPEEITKDRRVVEAYLGEEYAGAQG